MEFKEVVKIRRRMCNYYVECDDCHLYKPSRYCKNFPMSEEEIEEYEKILEEFAREHPVMTNADKYIEVIEKTFGNKLDKNKIHKLCPRHYIGLGVPCENCSQCLEWWDEEYKDQKRRKINE